MNIDTFNKKTTLKEKKFTSKIKESNGNFDVNLYQEVLKGETAIYIAKNVIDQKNCDRISSAFDNSLHKNCYDVFPPIEAIGEPLYFADEREKYFKNAAENQKKTSEIFSSANTQNYPEIVFNEIKDKLSPKGIPVRLAQHNGIDAFYGIMRRWGYLDVDEKNRAARLHEDRVQLRFHEGLETIKCINSPLVSICIYYENGESGGELLLYDYRPSLLDAESEELNTANRYGFSDKWKEGLDFIKIRPEKGDIICFWADYLHEVNAIKGRWRINSTFFSSLTDEKEVLIWS